ncbi:GAF domain-containing sensor histidine kinase [Acetivibrio straminisolvens]|uniref:GAF domain-containing sensor histidine kinase n=1 Tax=Acetivibrio straminisolvens TaxID=253314 RepID=UPI0004AFC77D|nr:GAF domain-containing sensor histidine kinase [Acetivibrio straminisolvens]
MESFAPKSSKSAPPLSVVFVEYSVFAEILPRLDKVLGKLDFILVVFSSKKPVLDRHAGNVFEYIYTEQFSMPFFLNKLKNEISNRKKICFLKYEVKEFYEIGKSLSSEKDAVKLLDMIITSSINLTSSDAGTIYLVIDKNTYSWTSVKDGDYKDKILKFVIAKNMSIDINLEAFTSPISRESIFGYSVITGKTIKIDDAYKLNPNLEYRHNNGFDTHTGYITKSILTIPMKNHENSILGVIQLINKKKFRDQIIDFSNPNALSDIISYDYTDELLMNSLAGQAAVALENNLLYKDMQNLLDSYKTQNNELEMLSKKILKAHEEERKRIAREIHDGPAQAMANLTFKVELLKKLIQSSQYEKCTKELDALNAAIKSTSKEIRTLLYDLKPSFLDAGLIAALQNRFGIFEENTGIKVEFNVSGDDSQIEYYIASTLYRMLQESLSNIQKHSRAKNVTVDFSIDDSMIYVTLTDDGVGFDPKQKLKKSPNISGGFGLRGLKERAELVKGKVDIKSSPGKGTCVSICIPL